jgi:HK97 gp10 family phage protein
MQQVLTGVPQLLAKLEKARVQMTGPEMKKAVRAGGNVIKAEMVSRAPVLDEKTAGSTSLDPGALKADIRVSLPHDEDEIVALIGPSSKTAHVARWVEYGHREVHGGSSEIVADGKSRGPGKAAANDVPEHPFLRPAFEASLTAAGEAITESLKKSFQEVLK